MTAISDVREEIASAISAKGWNTYRVVPETPRFPLVVVTIERVEYQTTYSGKMKLFLDIHVYTSLQSFTQGQDLLDDALSWGTDHSIPDALVSYDFEHVSSAAFDDADQYGAVQLHDEYEALTATLHVVITTS